MTIDQELETAVADAVSEEAHDDSPPVETQSRPLTLAEQLGTIQRAEQELRRRLRRERMDIQARYDAMVVEINNDFDRRIEYAVTGLEDDRRAALARMRDSTAERLREHELLVQKMG